MYGRYRKVDPSKISALRQQGLSNTQIAQRPGVSLQVLHYTLRKIAGDKVASRKIAG